MCRSTAEGGMRCAAHTRPAFNSATFGTAQWDTAAAAYAATTEGERVLTDELYRADVDGNIERSIACEHALKQGRGQYAIAKQTAAEIAALNDDEAVHAYLGEPSREEQEAQEQWQYDQMPHLPNGTPFEYEYELAPGEPGPQMVETPEGFKVTYTSVIGGKPHTITEERDDEGALIALDGD